MSNNFRLWKISPWQNGEKWEEWKEENKIEMGCYGGDEFLECHIIDEYKNPKNFYKKVGIVSEIDDDAKNNRYVQIKNFIWGIKKGDFLLAKKKRKIVGVGEVKDNQNYDFNDFIHTKYIFWHELENPLIINNHSFLKDFFKGARIQNTIYPLDKIKNETINLLRKTNPGIIPNGNNTSLFPLINILLDKNQLILYGPPGTGKTFKARELAVKLMVK